MEFFEQPKLVSPLMEIYRRLSAHFGKQHWWPAETALEMCVGAILTQNTSWVQVEKAMAGLKARRLLAMQTLFEVPEEELAYVIQPAGSFRVKARRIKNFMAWVKAQGVGVFAEIFAGQDWQALRRELLTVNGLGPETVDSMLLYAGNKPSFVVDAYTYRVLSRHGLMAEEAHYYEVQEYFTAHLPEDPQLFNEYHALLVKVGKEFCKKGRPLCERCPLKGVE